MATLAKIADELSSSPAALAREAIIGSPASIKAAALAELGLSSSAAALASMRATILPEDLLSMRATIPEDTLAGLRVSVSDLLPAADYRAQLESMGAALGKPAELAASLTRELGSMYGLADNQQARYFLEQFERDDRRSRQMAMQALEGSDQWRKLLEPALEGSDQWRKLLEPTFIDRAIWPGPEQLADLYRQLGQPYDVSEMADILAARQAPAVITRRPEPQPPPKRLPPPQSGNFGIQPAQPGQPADWQTLLADVLQAGQATTESIVQWLLQQDRGSQQPPQWEFVRYIGEQYEQNGWRYDNMGAFARKHGIGRATLIRYLEFYEAGTGKRVRPGQGRSKRKGGR